MNWLKKVIKVSDTRFMRCFTITVILSLRDVRPNIMCYKNIASDAYVNINYVLFQLISHFYLLKWYLLLWWYIAQYTYPVALVLNTMFLGQQPLDRRQLYMIETCVAPVTRRGIISQIS